MGPPFFSPTPILPEMPGSRPVRVNNKTSLDRRTKPGTKFLREWNGRTHEVVAMADGGFLYRGIAYRSLSAIAREITGTRWSGPAFFGLDAGKGKGRRHVPRKGSRLH